jgi:DNA-binding response OmpR family regulator
MQRPAPCILIVEDDPAIQTLLLDILHEQGYATMCCQAAQEAQALIMAEQPDLCILDIHLLDRPAGGWEVLSLARLLPATTTVPIIVCSADIRFLEVKRQELHAQRCIILPKPFELDVLLAAVAASLDLRQAERSVPD